MKVLFALLLTLLMIGSVTVASPQATSTANSPAKAVTLVGRWRVRFSLIGSSEKNLIFEAREQGTGSFRLLDTGPDDKPVPIPAPAVWSQTSTNVSISGEVELPLGTCCRETGALILKAKLTGGESVSGKVIFVTNVEEDESPYKFRSTVGTFTATRLHDK